jgi:hypothetical protein
VDEPRVDRSEGGARRVHPAFLDQPLDLRAGEVGVEHEAGVLADELFVALVLQLLAAVGGPAVLPDDRVVQRLAGVPVPGDDRLTLIGDADGLEVLALRAGVVYRFLRDGFGDIPDLAGVVLHPAGLREVLFELAVGAAGDLAVLVEDHAGRAGRALIDGEDHERREA